MIITRAPLRLSLFGGGSDYPEFFDRDRGAVLSTAIDRHCFVTANAFPSHLFDYSIRLSYREVELVRRRDEIRHRVFKSCLETCGIEADVELHTMADLPAFTGLGSSSSFTVALLHALRAYQGRYLSPMELAYEAIRVERGLLGDTVGCQDQVLAAVGGLRRVELRRVDDIFAENLCVSPQRKLELQSHLVMVYTALQRPASPLERSKLDRVEANRAALRRMVAMVDEAADLLLGTAPIEGLGEMLDESWRLKRGLAAGVSNDAMDAMYRRGRDAGALGGKILGAGGGGFLLFFVPPERQEQLIAAFPDHEILHPRIDRPGSEVLFASADPER